MSWANHYIEQLKKGETVQFRPRGHSMKGKIASGQLVTVGDLWHLHGSGTVKLYICFCYAPSSKRTNRHSCQAKNDLRVLLPGLDFQCAYSANY
jgi:hypothetical protein